jgi:hypothetical protein
MMSSQFSLFCLVATLFLILAIGQFQPVEAAAAALGESIDSAVGVVDPERAVENLGAEHPAFLQRRIKRGISCILGRYGCIRSCQWQHCSTGYCDNGVCRCSRCY